LHNNALVVEVRIGFLLLLFHYKTLHLPGSFLLLPPVLLAFVSASLLRFYVSWTDAALVEALESDNWRAFAEIYERYWYRVFTLAYRKLKSRETAEELVQELFIALWHKRAQQPIIHLENYLLVAINHRVLTYIRAHRVRTHYAAYCRKLLPEATHETEDTLAAADLSAAFLRGVELLPEKSREVFRLSRLEHQSVAEIAARLEVTPKAVEYHLTKSLKRLRMHLREFLAM
jgi:RNA polymerase sigma-70 factor (family 1)